MDSRDDRDVCGLVLPGALVEAMRAGRWRVPDDRALLERVFSDEAPAPVLYFLGGMRSETSGWHAENDPDVVPHYVCRPDEARPPGDISQHASVLIGDLAPDQMIALDIETLLRQLGLSPPIH